MFVPCSVIGDGLHPSTLVTTGVKVETRGMKEREAAATDMMMAHKLTSMLL